MQKEYVERLFLPKMEFYREVYKNSPRWDGLSDLEGKDVIVYCEQGYGDIIHFARYLTPLKSLGCRIHLHCPEPLHALLLQHVKGIDSVFDKEETNLPHHDVHTLSMSLPFLLGIVDVPVPYIKINEKMDLSGEEKPGSFKIGIAWEGNPDHSNNDERSAPLGVFRQIHNIPEVSLYTIQQTLHNAKLVEGCEDMTIYGAALPDFRATATLINSMDLIVSVDTSVLHLAGAMGKNTIGLLGKNRDPRWDSGVKWYPSVTLMEQDRPGNWASIAAQMTFYVRMEVTRWITRQLQS